MAFPTKDWRDAPESTTPIDAAALEDLETRLGGYADDRVATKAPLSHTHEQADVAGLDDALAARIPKAIVDAKGDLIVATADGTVVRLAVGAQTGDVLTIDPAEPTGLKWATPPGGTGDTVTSGRFYGDTSSYNKPVPATPVLHPNSQAMVDKLNGWGLPANLLPGTAGHATWKDYGSPRYFASNTDPLFTVRQNDLNYPGSNWDSQIRIPQAALPANGTDYHMVVVSPDGLTEWYMYAPSSTSVHKGSPISPTNPLPDGGGEIFAGGLGKYATDGSGLPNPYAGGGDKATAGGLGGLSGDVEPDHLRAKRIPHALRMAVKSTGTDFDADGIVAPALGAAGMTDPTNAPPDGARFWLDMTEAEIDALALGQSSKTLLHAMREFGMYVMDTGSTWKVYIESGQAKLALDGVDPWRTYAADVGVPEGSMTYNATDDIYVWSEWKNAVLSDGVTSIWTRLRVLDWTDPANH